jgi:hypothetical protein
MGILGCRTSGDRKTGAAILSVATAGAKMGGVLTQDEQAALFHSTVSQITTANRSILIHCVDESITIYDNCLNILFSHIYSSFHLNVVIIQILH